MRQRRYALVRRHHLGGDAATPEAVTDALAAYQRLHGAGLEFGGDEEGNDGLTNHGPMAAEVIVRRGSTYPSSTGWTGTAAASTISRRLRAASTPATGARHWAITAASPDWTAYFREELRGAPWHDVLTRWWPSLLPGIAARSTHGVIRVGHAVRTLVVTDHDQVLDELANGLAFWAARWRPITAGQGDGGLTPATALDALPRLPDQIGFIAHRISRDCPEVR